MKAGITFPPTRCTRLLRKAVPTDRVSARAGVLIASVLENLIAELNEAAGDICKEQGRKQIKPRHIMMALKADDQLATVFGKSALASAGVIPNIHPELEVVAKRTKKRKAKADKVSKKADKKKAKAVKKVKA